MVNEATHCVTRTVECHCLLVSLVVKVVGLAVSVQNVAQRPEREPSKTMCVPSSKGTGESSSGESWTEPQRPDQS